MFKKTTYLLTAALLGLSIYSISCQAAEPDQTDNTVPLQAKTDTLAPDQAAVHELEQIAEKITVDEMKTRLEQHNADDVLYIKVNEKDVFVFRDNIKNPSQRHQILYLLPAGQMQHFYTNNKKTSEQMYKTLRHFQSTATDLNGYRIVTDKDKVDKKALDPIYHLWALKLKYTRIIAYAPYWDYPLGIGIGWDYWHHYGHWGGPGPRHHGGGPHGPRGHHR